MKICPFIWLHILEGGSSGIFVTIYIAPRVNHEGFFFFLYHDPLLLKEHVRITLQELLME